jgi:hypothetical protein
VIPEDVLRFVRDSIKSVWALELLLFMRRNAAQAWTVEQLTKELRSSPQLVTDILASFTTSGLVGTDADGTFRYCPASADLDALVTRLDRIYAETPLALIKQIVSTPNEKIQSFSDAFRIKRD